MGPAKRPLQAYLQRGLHGLLQLLDGGLPCRVSGNPLCRHQCIMISYSISVS